VTPGLLRQPGGFEGFVAVERLMLSDDLVPIEDADLKGAGLGRGAAVLTRSANPPDYQDALLAELDELLCLSTEALTG
jgi:hypothetical protein